MKEYDKYVGKRFAWKEIVGMFPNKWVALSDCKFKDNNTSKPLIAGIIRAICDDANVNNESEKLLELGIDIYWKRKTELLEVNGLW